LVLLMLASGPTSGLRMKRLSLMAEDEGACPQVEGDLLSPLPKWAGWLGAESAVQ